MMSLQCVFFHKEVLGQSLGHVISYKLAKTKSVYQNTAKDREWEWEWEGMRIREKGTGRKR